MPGPFPVVLALSGRPGAATAIGRLSASTGAPVVTVTLDLGQGADLEQIAAEARQQGAARAHVIDARDAFAADVILPALRAGATGGALGIRAAALARPAIVRALVDVARMEGATRVAHGASGADRIAMDQLLADAAPELHVIDLEPSLRQASLEPAIAANLWGRTVTVSAGIARHAVPPAMLYQRTSQPASWQAQPATVDVTFERGLPVAVNGITMSFVELVEVVETIAGDHGVGRSETRNEIAGTWQVVESPAALMLGLALATLEQTTLAPRLAMMKSTLAFAYAACVDEGAWFSTARRALDAFMTAASAEISGTVRVELFQGECRVFEPGTAAAVQSVVSAGQEPVL